MEGLAKVLKHFVLRDVVYVIGGASVMLSGLYWLEPPGFDETGLQKLPTVVYLIAIGFAYVIGYAIQEGACLTGVFTTASVEDLPYFRKGFYEHFVRKEWVNIKGLLPDRTELVIRLGEKEAKTSALDELERTTFLKQIGATCGPCAFVSAVFLFARCCRGGELFSRFTLFLGFAVLAVGAILWALSWVKVGQESQLLVRINAMYGCNLDEDECEQPCAMAGKSFLSVEGKRCPKKPR